jgi:alpha-tubulin suppressor-like RCC1 family protein
MSSPVVDIAAAVRNNWVVLADGKVWEYVKYNINLFFRWGVPTSGNFGTGTTSTTAVSYASAFQLGGLSDIVNITVNGWTVIALSSTGLLYSWGSPVNYMVSIAKYH